jgi:hypothetical protein
MSANRVRWPIATMARLLGVSTSGFYAWRVREPSARSCSDARLLAHIRTLYASSRGTYGAPRIHAQLAREGVHVGRKRVARLMRIAGLCGATRGRWPRTTRARARARRAPDLVQHHFSADATNVLWVAHATYVPTGEGFLYLAVVLDVFSRRIVGWAMSNHLYTFAGVKVRGRTKPGLDVTRGFTEGEWLLLRAIADGLEWSYGWNEAAAQHLRFLLDFGYATGLRASEPTGATLGDIRTDEHADHWLYLVGKGGKTGKVALPTLARMALDQYLAQRRLPVTRERWDPATVIVASLAEDGTGIETTRLGRVLRRFFALVADTIGDERPAMA